MSTPPLPQVQPVAPSASGRAVASLVLGILGVTILHILAPGAWYLAVQELRDIRAARAPAAGESYASVGLVLGVIGTVLLAMLALVAVAAIVFGFGVAWAAVTHALHR